MTREAVLADTFVQLADTLIDDFDVVDLLTLLADRSVEVLDADAAGTVLAAPDGHLHVVAVSSQAVRVLELFELQAEEGPSLDAYRTGTAIVAEDLTTFESHWPRFARRALAAGFRSLHAVPMCLRGATIGVLNLFRAEQHRADGEEVQIAEAFASVATIAILQHRARLEAQAINEQLSHALNSRVVIEQAKGMLSERLGVSMGQAFEALRRHARNHNRRLAEVAAEVINGTIDTSALRTPRRRT